MEPSRRSPVPEKPTALRRRRDLVLVASLLAAAGIWFGNAPARPQKLAEVTSPERDGGWVTLLGTRGDRIYLFRRDEGAILAVRRNGGRPELIGSKREELRTASGIGILGSDFLFQADGITANVMPAGSPERSRKLQAAAIYREPLAGGELALVPFPQLRGQSAVLSGDTCFALEAARPFPDRVPSQSRLPPPLALPQVRIWRVDAGSSTPRIAATAPALDILLGTVVGSDGFYARTPVRDRLVHVHRSGAVEVHSAAPGARLLAEAGDDLAWSEVMPGRGSDPTTTDVYLTRHDGSERRALFQLTSPTGRQQSLMALVERDGKWFGIVQDVDLADGTQAQQLLARFHPGRKQVVQVLAVLPKRRPVDRFEEKELDFLAVEEKERSWDWSAAGLVAQRTTNLYRFPLPVR